MNLAQIRVKEVLRGFGFDAFMVEQIYGALKARDLINEEPLGDSMTKVLESLEDQGWELDEIQAAVKAMLEAGVVFRER
jgi:hypothetical protein